MKPTFLALALSWSGVSAEISTGSSFAESGKHFSLPQPATGVSWDMPVAPQLWPNQVWPLASGAINGISNGDRMRFETPRIELTLTDLHPRSVTSFMLYEGSSVDGSQGTVIKSFPWTSDTITRTSISVTGLASKFTKNGTYTVALVSKTVHGTELLCPPVTFEVDRTIRVNAMLVTYSNEAENP